MTFEEAIRKSISSYLKGEEPKSLAETHEGGLKYTLKFFDDLEADLLGEKKASRRGKKAKDEE